MSSGTHRPHGPRGRDEPLSSSRMLKLMAYVDGEIDGEERAEVERWLASDERAARFADELSGLGELVTEAYAESDVARSVATFDVADAVLSAVTKESSAAAGADDVAKTAPLVRHLDVARAARARNAKIGATLAAALALAASVFVMTRNGAKEQPMARSPSSVAQPASYASAEPGVDVDLVETAGDSVRVFYLASENSPTTSVVVWVDESGGK